MLTISPAPIAVENWKAGILTLLLSSRHRYVGGSSLNELFRKETATLTATKILNCLEYTYCVWANTNLTTNHLFSLGRTIYIYKIIYIFDMISKNLIIHILGNMWYNNKRSPTTVATIDHELTTRRLPMDRGYAPNQIYSGMYPFKSQVCTLTLKQKPLWTRGSTANRILDKSNEQHQWFLETNHFINVSTRRNEFLNLLWFYWLLKVYCLILLRSCYFNLFLQMFYSIDRCDWLLLVGKQDLKITCQLEQNSVIFGSAVLENNGNKSM